MFIKTFFVKLVLPFCILIVVITAVGYLVTETVASEASEVTVQDLAIDMSAAGIARGANLYITRGCAGCHGEDAGGQVLFDDKLHGRIVASNLTTGEGGKATDYNSGKGAEYNSGRGWDRAIRYGENMHSKKLALMPSNLYYDLSDQDSSSIIGFLKSRGGVSRTLPKQSVGPLYRFLYLLGLMPGFYAFDQLDTHKPHAASVLMEPTKEYGKYVATACASCHGDDMTGGYIIGNDPRWPKPPDITSKGIMANYPFETFGRLIRQGVGNAGHKADPKYMPWPALSHLEDAEIQGLYLYLKSI